MKELNIEYNRFERGIDLRKSSAVSDANRMQNLENCYVTKGWAIRKREGAAGWLNITETSGLAGSIFTDPTTGEDSYGLITAKRGANQTVSPIPSVSVDAELPNLSVVSLIHPDEPLAEVGKIHAFEVFNGLSYLVVEFETNLPASPRIVHFYDNVAVTLTNFRQPKYQPKSITKIGSKIYAIDGDVVRFSKTSAPTDWVGTDDAGFLPVGLQAPSENIAQAVTEFNGQLAVFFEDSIQIWAVDPDPALNQLVSVVRGGGTIYPKSIQSFSNDVIYLTSTGFRSLSRQQFKDNFNDDDVGSPIDDLVRERLALVANFGVPFLEKAFSVYYQKLGQYICFINNLAYVYTRSTGSQVAAWSIYRFPFVVSDAISIGRFLILMSPQNPQNNNIYYFDERAKEDGAIPFKVEVLFSFQAQKAPAINKRFNSMDIVQEGACQVSHLYNPRDLTQETNSTLIDGNTRPIRRYPMGLLTTEIATRLVNETNEDWQFDSLMYFYNKIGVRV